MPKKRVLIEADSRRNQIDVFVKYGANHLYPQLLRKNYKIPVNYINWADLAALVAMMAPEFNNPVMDLAQRFTGHRMALWLAQDAPIYCLDKNLLELFQATDIGDESLIFKDL